MILLPLIIDFFLPDPTAKLHPIALLGRWIGWLEKRLNQAEHKRIKGLFLWFVVVSSLLVLLQPLRLLPEGLHIGLSVILAFFMFSGRSLAREGEKIFQSLKTETIEQSRHRLSWIVGRDTTHLDEPAIIKATIETVAENTIDGLIAPAFYYLLGSLFGVGLEGLVLYKAVNTMDSMLGYQNERFHEFGTAAARLDDLFNLLPARLGAWLMILATVVLGYPLKRTLRVYWRDKNKHSSPNAGQPESVVAGALGIQLGGDNLYGGRMVSKPTIGDAINQVSAEMILQTNRILQLSHGLIILLAGLILLLGGHL